MNRKKKNQLKYFYQILSDIKNNIDTLVKELYENKDNLGKFAESKPVIKKSKYPDLKKLGILRKTSKWEITDIGRELIDIYERGDQDEYQKILASILGTYNFGGFRPYAVLCKFFYIKFGKGSIDRNEGVKFFSLPINEAMFYINSDGEETKYSLKNEEMEEAPRPYSYVINHLKNAGLIKEDNEGKIRLTDDIEEFLGIFFSEIDSVPRYKKESSLKCYRIMSRGTDQVTFRNELLEVYKGRCAITGKYFKMGNNNLLEAAHIIPVSQGGSYEVNNGLLMTPNLHKAFDAGAITFDESYNMIVFETVEEERYLPKNKKIS